MFALCLATVVLAQPPAPAVVPLWDGKAPHAAREDQQLVETRSRQTANSRHAIADLDNPADRIEPRFERQVPDVLAVSVELGAGLCRKRFGYEVTLQAGSRFRGSLDVPWPPF